MSTFELGQDTARVDTSGTGPLRILHVINMGVTCGGAEGLLSELVDSQRAAGHQVCVLSSDLPGSGTRFSDVTWPQATHRVGWFARLSGQVRNPPAGAALVGLLRRFAPHVVHLHTVGLLAPASLSVLADTPTVLTVHGPEVYVRSIEHTCMPAHYFRRPAGRRRELTLRGRLVVLAMVLFVGRLWRRRLRVVDITLAPSRYLADLLGHDLGPTRVVPNGFGRVVQPLKPPDRAPADGEPRQRDRLRLVFIGRLEHIKGPQVMIEAMPAVLAAHPDAMLTICGSGSMEPTLRAMVDRYSLAGSVEFTGWLERAGLQRRLTDADLVVVPSIGPEAFGLSCLEAYAAGIPVVASAVGGLPDLVRPGVTGVLVPPGDVAALARAVNDLLTDPDRRRQLGQAARALHAEYTLDAHVTAVSDAYQEAIALNAKRTSPTAKRTSQTTKGTGGSRVSARHRFGAQLRSTLVDSLLRNSALLLVSTLVLAGGGFLFWRMVTHLLPAADVGQAGALISASTLVVNLAQLGLNNSLIRYLGEWPDRSRTVNTAMTVVAAAALLGTVVFLGALPLLAPALVSIRHPVQMSVFAALAVAGAVGLYFDTVFVALRRSGYLLGRNLLVVALRLSLPLLILGSTAFDIFVAYWLALAIALPLYFTAARRFGLRARLSVSTDRLRAMWRFSTANYLSTAILMTPTLLMPTLVAQRVGAQPAAYYYIASLVASVLTFVPQATARSFFAEVSHNRNRLREHLSRVIKVTALLQLPLLALLLIVGRPTLRLFGADYVAAYPLLILLASAGALSSVGFIGSTILLISGRTRLLLQLSASAYTAALLGAYVLADRGLVWIGGALLAGELLLAAGYLRIILGALRGQPAMVPSQPTEHRQERKCVS